MLFCVASCCCARSLAACSAFSAFFRFLHSPIFVVTEATVRRSSAARAGRLPVCAAECCLPHCSHPIYLLLTGKLYVGCCSQGDRCLHLSYTCVLLASRPHVGYRSRRAQQMASCTFVSSCLLLAGRPYIGCPSRQIFHNNMIYPKLYRLTATSGAITSPLITASTLLLDRRRK
jgi:hypothetical protein